MLRHALWLLSVLQCCQTASSLQSKTKLFKKMVCDSQTSVTVLSNVRNKAESERSTR